MTYTGPGGWDNSGYDPTAKLASMLLSGIGARKRANEAETKAAEKAQVKSSQADARAREKARKAAEKENQTHAKKTENSAQRMQQGQEATQSRVSNPPTVTVSNPGKPKKPATPKATSATPGSSTGKPRQFQTYLFNAKPYRVAKPDTAAVKPHDPTPGSGTDPSGPTFVQPSLFDEPGTP